MVLATLFVLFAQDVWLLAFPPSADIVYLVIVFVCFILFLVELVLSFIADGLGYFKFFFWCDLITLLSMIPEVVRLFVEPDSTKQAADSRFGFLVIARAGRFGCEAVEIFLGD